MIKPATYFACLMAVAALAGCNSKKAENAAKTENVKYEHTTVPKGGDWSDVINATPDGGVMMGDPNAKVHLIEIGSLTCPHCREFDEKGVPPLIANYVKTGIVSWEFRNYVRDAFDLTASLIARCNGAKSFFPLARAFYKDQDVWVDKIRNTPQDQIEQLQNLPPNQQFVELAKVADFQNWAAARGVPVAKTNQCLSDENTVNQLVQMTSDATTQFPDFPGTPTFILNGHMLEKTATWEQLEPQLRAVLGERG